MCFVYCAFFFFFFGICKMERRGSQSMAPLLLLVIILLVRSGLCSSGSREFALCVYELVLDSLGLCFFFSTGFIKPFVSFLQHPFFLFLDVFYVWDIFDILGARVIASFSDMLFNN